MHATGRGRDACLCEGGRCLGQGKYYRSNYASPCQPGNPSVVEDLLQALHAGEVQDDGREQDGGVDAHIHQAPPCVA